MTDFRAAKVVAAVPSPPEPDTVYFVRAGPGFDLYVTNGVGVPVAYPLNQDAVTAEQVKQLYESNPNTNAFTDAEEEKLSNIADNATANRSDSENADKVHTHTMAQVTGLDTALAQKAALNATANQQGGLKARLDGTTLYLTNNGTNP